MRSVVVLGVISLLMDVASEMLYPVAPLFLTATLGASMAWVGVIEGIAEGVSGLSKGYFGSMSDRWGRRRLFLTAGYGLSALSKPLPALFASVGGVIGSRVLDRIGKGVRTAPRDALLAGYVPAEKRGAAFGLHRAMDTTGAAIGPIAARLYLGANPGDHTTLFLLAFIPAGLAALGTVTVRESRFAPTSGRPGLRDTFGFWRMAPTSYRRLVLWLTLFALVNSSDVFLILRARDVAVAVGFGLAPDIVAVGSYIGYNLVFALAAWPAGRLSDRFGRRRVMIIGIFLYSISYAFFAVAGGIAAIIVGFVLYGLYAALVEGVVKAWIGDLIPNERRGLAIGLQTTLASIGMMVASGWTGGLWSAVGPSVPFAVAAASGLIVAVGLSAHARSDR